MDDLYLQPPYKTIQSKTKEKVKPQNRNTPTKDLQPRRSGEDISLSASRGDKRPGYSDFRVVSNFGFLFVCGFFGFFGWFLFFFFVVVSLVFGSFFGFFWVVSLVFGASCYFFVGAFSG